MTCLFSKGSCLGCGGFHGSARLFSSGGSRREAFQLLLQRLNLTLQLSNLLMCPARLHLSSFIIDPLTVFECMWVTHQLMKDTSSSEQIRIEQMWPPPRTSRNISAKQAEACASFPQETSFKSLCHCNAEVDAFSYLFVKLSMLI